MCAGTAAFAQEQVKDRARARERGASLLTDVTPPHCELRAQSAVLRGAVLKSGSSARMQPKPDKLRLPRGVQRREEGVRRGRAHAEEA